ncbi:MAG: amino acid permease [Planctomycetes bacterium]|nr:amino acid permease [Planctomycetota bacterium]
MKHHPEGELKRVLGPLSAIAITVGAVIGSGIFLKPVPVAHAVPSELWIHVIWVVLGVVCLFGAYAYAELGAMLPEAGGQYSFLREGWGRFVGFLYGWTFFWVINSGTMAALALAFADNVLTTVQVDEASRTTVKVAIASAMILLLAVVNHVGTRHGALVQNLSTFCKLGALGLIVLAGLRFAEPAASDGVAAAAAVEPVITSGGVVTACLAVFWAYEGWYQLPFNAAELKRPERDLPLGLVVGLLILIATYVLVNVVYLRVVPLPEMLALDVDTERMEVPMRTVVRAIDPQLASWLTLLIAISVFGAANPNLLSSPRAFYEMARDKLVLRALMHVDRRTGTPTISIWAQAVWGVALVAGFQKFDDVTVYVVFAALLFYALAVAAVYRLRVLQPDRPRPFRCLGYPVTPALFIAVVISVDVLTLLDPLERRNALIGLAIIATGVPAYAFLRPRG